MVSLGSFTPSASSIYSFLSVLIWGLIIIAILFPLIVFIRNKIKYRYTGEIWKRRQDNFNDGLPSSNIISGKAGYFKNKNGKTIFRIKYGKMPWQKIETTKLPDPKYMIGEKVYYQQLQKDNLIQAKIEVDWEGTFKLQPIEDDVCFAAQQSIMETNNILKTSKLTPITIGFIVMGLVLVTGIVVFYFLTKA